MQMMRRMLVLGSLVSFAYYLRVVAAMWLGDSDAEAAEGVRRAPEVAVVAVVAALAITALAVAPGWPLDKAGEVGNSLISSR
ncbi:MAG: hypothetical protein WCO96_09065 [Actinomycetes bacterium]